MEKELMSAVQQITDLHGDNLEYVAKTIYATVFMGKIPNRGDLAVYIGTSKTRLSRVLKGLTLRCSAFFDPPHPLVSWFGRFLPTTVNVGIGQVIYPLAADATMKGLYIGTTEEPIERAVTRIYLGSLIPAQSIQTYESFAGLNIMIEYLQCLFCGEEIEFSSFVRLRFGRSAVFRVNAFLQTLYESNQHLADSVPLNYDGIRSHLEKGLQKTRLKFFSNASAKIAKSRLEIMVRGQHNGCINRSALTS